MTRLYVTGKFLGFQRSQANQNNSTALVQIEGVSSKEDAEFYLGKRVAMVYKGSRSQKTPTGNETKFRVVWGKITRSHGNSGVVRTKWQTNLNPRWMGASVKVMLYPSRV